MATGTPEKLKDKGVDGKGKVQDMQKEGGSFLKNTPLTPRI